MSKRLVVKAQVLLLLACPGTTMLGQSTPAAGWTVAAPAPTGPSKVGTVVMRAVDSRRSDPFLADGTKREVLIRFWYPAAPVSECRLAEYTSPIVWAYVSRITGIPLPEVKTNSCLGAPVSAGLHPVIVFSHGYTGTFTDCTFIFEDLASRGYVVASVAHTYETTAVGFPGGRLIKSKFGSYLAGDSLRTDEQSLRLVRAARLADLKFVLDYLQALTGSGELFAGKLDISHIAIMGHSLGAEVALASLESDRRLRAAILLDAPIVEEDARGTAKPLLMIAAGRENWSDEECSLWSNLRGPRLAVNLLGAGHYTPTDLVWLFKDQPGLGLAAGQSPERIITLLRNLVAGFFNSNLREGTNKPGSLAMSSGSRDAVVTNQGHSLCSAHTAAVSGGLR